MSLSTPPLRTHRDKALISLQCLWLALVGVLLQALGIRSLWRKLLAVLCLATLSLGASAQNRSYEFTTSDTVTLTNAASALSNRTTFTIEFWAKFTSVSGTIGLVDFTGGADVGGLILNAGKLTVDLSCDFGCLTKSNALSLSAGTWYHIAAVFDNGTWDFYVDGVAQGTNVLDQGALTNVPDYAALAVSNLVFGLQNHSSVDDFVGSLDDIRLWSTARTQTQLQTNRSRELAGNEAGLIGYWKLNESSGMAVQDSQTNSTALPGTSSGVGFNATGAFDATAPTVVSVTSSSANALYKMGDTVDIQVNFSKPVTVTGTPQLTLETGATDRTVNYASGSGSSTLNFQYTVQAGDSSADLDYVATTSLVLNSGTIRDAGNNNAILALASPGAPNSLGSNKSLVIDGVMPAVTSTAPSGGGSTDTSVDFTARFSESVSNISTDDFSLGTTGSATGTIASVSASSGSSVTVTVSGITGNGTLRLNLNGGTNIADAAGNSVAAAYTSGTAHTVAIPTAPSAPTIGTATAGDRQVSVTFAAPGSNGGSAITTYTATAIQGGALGTCAGPAACTVIVSGLTNGTAYTFNVTATNAIGTSAASGTSNSATPKGNQTITFANPGTQNFGTTPTLSATALPSSLTPTFTSSTTGVCTITSGGTLSFVTAGSCTIDADQAGNTAWNAATTVPQTFTVNAVVPGAPTIGTATAGNTQATVTFTAPTSIGGAAIIASGYTVTANPGGATATGSSSPITVTGLSNGTAYTFTVTATNSAGTGSASAASNSVTPAAPQTIAFTNPGSQNFGTTPTLTATSSAGGGYPVSFTSSTTGVCTITSGGALTFVTVGSCTINADQAGDSSYLAATQVSQSFTVAAVVPAAPTAATAIAGDTQASVAFTAPAFTGGAAITGYTVTSSPGGITGSGASSPITVTGLTNGQTYTFTVRASNSAGTGAASSLSNAVMPAAPIAHAITATAQPSAGGSVTCTPSTVGEGGSATCTAVANARYVFQKWTGACAGQAAACNLTNVTAPPTSAALFQQEQTGLTVPEGAKQGEGLGLVLQPSAENWVIQSASTATVASTGTSAPSGVDLPHGLVNLKLVTGTAGTSATVVLTYPQALPAGTKYYKFGKTAANLIDHWYEFSGAVISGNTITLTIVDGGEGDNDLTANSVIDDPGGPAVVTPPPPPPSPSLTVNLQVTTSGPGVVQRSVAGSVVGTLGSTTTVEYPQNQAVTLTAQPQVGARFTGWSGACSGLLACSLTLRSNEAVQATFSTVPAATCRARAFSADEERMLGAYLAYYGRPADVGGLAYWVAGLAGDPGRIDATTDAFGHSYEFQRRFGQMNGEQLIANLYQQMYGRQPDAPGAAYYGSQLASGQSSLVSIAIHILDGRLGRDRAVLDNRHKVARHFVTRFEELGSAAPVVLDGYALSRLVADVGNDDASTIAGCAWVDEFLDKTAGP